MAVKVLNNQGVPANAELLNILNNNDAISFFREFRQVNDSDVSFDEEIELTVLPAHTTQYSVNFKKWHKQVLIKLDAKLSMDGTTLLGYVTRADDAHVAYANLNMTIPFCERTKAAARHAGPTYEADNRRLCATLTIACAKCGLSFVEKYATTSDGCRALADLIENYYGSSGDEIKVMILENKLKGAQYHSQEIRPWEEFVGDLCMANQGSLRLAVHHVQQSWLTHSEMMIAIAMVKADRAGRAIDFEVA